MEDLLEEKTTYDPFSRVVLHSRNAVGASTSSSTHNCILNLQGVQMKGRYTLESVVLTNAFYTVRANDNDKLY